MTVSEAVRDVGALVPTPNDDAQPRRFADFATFCDALDFAAAGDLGFNFHDARGTLTRVYPYSELRADALIAAQRLIAMGIAPGDRVALIADQGAWKSPVEGALSFHAARNAPSRARMARIDGQVFYR